MSSFEENLVKELIKGKKYEAISDFCNIEYSDKKLIVTESVYDAIRVRKEEDGTVHVMCPKNMTVVQESALTDAISRGTIFDDADEVDGVAKHITMSAVPINGMINMGMEPPKKLPAVVATVVGKMDDDGRCCPTDADVQNGQNLIKDLVDKDNLATTASAIINHYTGNKDNLPIGVECGKEALAVEEEVNNIKTVSPDSTLSVDDYVELNPLTGKWEDEEPEENGLQTSADDNEYSDDTEDDDSDMAETIEETDTAEVDPGAGVEEDVDTTTNTNVKECGDNCNKSDTVMECEGNYPSNGANYKPAIKDGKVVTEEETEDADAVDDTVSDEETTDVEECGAINYDNDNGLGDHPYSPKLANLMSYEEGFFTKKPKKLKPIPRDVIAYITVELNAIQDANDQAMLSGYTCSKLELVDFYLNCIDTNDARYIVPHTKAYLEQMQKELNSLLAQILRIRPINKSDRIWNVNYPDNWR